MFRDIGNEIDVFSEYGDRERMSMRREMVL